MQKVSVGGGELGDKEIRKQENKKRRFRLRASLLNLMQVFGLNRG